MCNPNYRITIVPLTEHGEKDFPEELRGGVECEGLVLIADKGDSTLCTVQSMSKSDIAAAIAGDSCLLSASHIAKAIRESKEMELRFMSPLDLLKNLAK